MKIKHAATWLAISLSLLLIPVRPALADVAPPAPPPGGNPGPGGEGTQVQMAAETVTLEVHSLNSSSPKLAGDVAEAAVTARFTMRNLGPADEKMQVRFPLADPSGSGDGFFNYPEVSGLTAAVNRSPVPTTRITTPNPGRAQDPPVAWAAFDVTFPPGQDVLIEVNYTLQAEGYLPYASFTYILETGAGWKGPIGAADVIVRLPYEAGPQNVLEGTGWSTTTPGAQFAGNEMRWHFENLEPTRGDNIEASLVAPYAWQAVLDARTAAEARPGDGDAWGTLARAYKRVALVDRGVREDPGGEELYRLSVEAYEKAVALAPKTAKWHAGYAELLWQKFYYGAFGSEALDYGPLARVAQELHTAIALEPQNEQALQLLDWISGEYPDAVAHSGTKYTFLILTATPAAVPTVASAASDTPAPVLSATQPPSVTPAPSGTSVESASPTVMAAQQATLPAPAASPSPRPSSSPICGAAIIAPLIVAACGARARRRRGWCWVGLGYVEKERLDA